MSKYLGTTKSLRGEDDENHLPTPYPESTHRTKDATFYLVDSIYRSPRDTHLGDLESPSLRNNKECQGMARKGGKTSPPIPHLRSEQAGVILWHWRPMFLRIYVLGPPGWNEYTRTGKPEVSFCFSGDAAESAE